MLKSGGIPAAFIFPENALIFWKNIVIPF